MHLLVNVNVQLRILDRILVLMINQGLLNEKTQPENSVSCTESSSTLRPACYQTASIHQRKICENIAGLEGFV